MTQLTYNFGAQLNEHYYVQEPHGKRPFPVEFEADMEYVPRTKRRFDKISACLENFSISNDRPSQINFCRDSSSDDEEMEEAVEMTVESTSAPLVVEPDDEPAVAKKIRLDETIQKYLERCRKQPMLILPQLETLQGNEMVLWQPRLLISPKNEINMAGRIQEIDDDEEDRVNEELKERIMAHEGMLDDANTAVESSVGIVELDSGSEEHSDIGSSWSSPVPSPTSKIVELDADSLNSLTNGSVSDEEEMMELDD